MVRKRFAPVGLAFVSRKLIQLVETPPGHLNRTRVHFHIVFAKMKRVL